MLFLALLATGVAAQTISSGPCSGIPTTTQTQQNGYYVVVTSGTTTVSVPAYSYTTITGVAHTTVYAYSTTLTTTSTSTITTISVRSAPTTITVPTVPGFTPILCEPSYVNPTVQLPDKNTTGTVQSTVYVSTQPAYTVTAYDYTKTKTSTVTAGTTTLLKVKTVTTTIKRTDKTATAYAACSSINITPYNPGQQYIENVNPRGPYGYNYARVAALDQVDCCAQCQGNSSCSGSAYSPSQPVCILFLQDYPANVTCDPKLVGESTTYGAETLTYYISNSACGQYVINP